jgi:hypothetical protein
MQIITAWHRSSPELTVNNFKKCCISSAKDENYDMLWNGCKEECEGNKGTDCEDGDSNADW